ncbi:MAG: hypothetical protein LBH98_02475 [Chitinispirillales bacterium]|jgi:hypothetical protein|nr:hypothetical protein [Chitinispirillales bacterium]
MVKYYVLDWQTTAAIFVVVMVVMWFFSGVIKLPKFAAILIAAGFAVLIKYKWWWIYAQVSGWMRLMGMDV